MVVRSVMFACALATGLSAPCRAQPSSVPATLESLLRAEETNEPASDSSSQKVAAGPKIPAGVAVRPVDGVQHPDLEKAWAYYEVAVGKVTEDVRTALAELFDAATSRGDLDTAEKWQNAIERFEQEGELPVEGESKSVVARAVNDYKKARDELLASYDAVVKRLTMQKEITQARAVRDEHRSLERSSAAELSGKQSARRSAAADEKPKSHEPALARALVSPFIGHWVNERWGKAMEIRSDGAFIVEGNPADQWSGKWTLDTRDESGPCLVRTANNGQVFRMYKHPSIPGKLLQDEDTFRRK